MILQQCSNIGANREGIFLTDIPQIVEDLYFQQVTIPDEKDWPDYLRGDPAVIRGLYSFYYGLRMGSQISDALREEIFTLSEE